MPPPGAEGGGPCGTAVFLLEPDVAGGWGRRTVADVSVHPPLVSRLHYEFADWFGDDLVTSFPCFIVTERLAAALDAAGLTGYRLDAVVVSTGPGFSELRPGVELPRFRWLRVSGVMGVDDFAVAPDYRLAVSARALELLRRHDINGCLVEETAV